jgi:hypothetical protein
MAFVLHNIGAERDLKCAFNLQRSCPATWRLRALALQPKRRAAIQRLMRDDPSQRIQNVIARLPDWLRRDLSSEGDATRERAEDALAAVILSAAAEPLAS